LLICYGLRGIKHIVKNDEQFAPNCKCGAGRMFQGLFCVIMFFSSSPLEKEPRPVTMKSGIFSGGNPRGIYFMLSVFRLTSTMKIGISASGRTGVPLATFSSLHF